MQPYRYLLRWALSLGMLMAGASLVGAADWPRFRGPNGTGIAGDDTPAPTTWSPTKNLKWKVKLPGPGASSPIVVGGRVFVTCYSGYGVARGQGEMKDLKRHLVCVDRGSGKILWDKEVPAVLPEDPYSGAGVPAHGYASHTPVSDGKRVYVHFGKTGALAFDMEGQQLWKTSVGRQSDDMRWGSASSPILHENILIVTAGPESRAIIGLNAETGKEVWKTEIESLGRAWGTPILVQVEGNRTDLVLGTAADTRGLDPTTGKERWKNDAVTTSNSSPVAAKGVVYALESRYGGGGFGGKGGFQPKKGFQPKGGFQPRGGFGGRGGTTQGGALRAGGKEGTKSQTLWTSRAGNRFGTPVVFKDRVYYVAGGVVGCLDAKDGKEIYKERLDESAEPRGGGGFGGGFGGFGRGGSDYSSPVLAAGKLYYVKSSGTTYVFEAGDEFEQIAANRVTTERETFSGTPAISNGEIFLRSTGHLYCISEKK